MNNECIFCDIVDGSGEASIVYRDERVCAFMDISPVTPGHTLVVPNRHAPCLADLDADDGERMFRVGQRVAAALRVGEFRCEGVNLFLADGEAAGQEVFHAHLHIFPRFAGDGFGLQRSDDSRRIRSRRELDESAAELRAELEVA